MFAYAKRTGRPLAAVVFDLDHFKSINDTHGHAKGDEVLKAVGETTEQTLRASDFAGRYGGEEFVVLLPDTDQTGAVVAAEKLREILRERRITELDEDITASFGIAVTTTGYEDAAHLLAAADAALYRAKAAGRDRIEVAGRSPDGPHRVGALSGCAS
jgi:diguanylate cyclase (GGDEF)-like protein